MGGEARNARLWAVTAFQTGGAAAPGGIHDIPVRDAEGRQRTLGDYRGDVLLIVNTASY